MDMLSAALHDHPAANNSASSDQRLLQQYNGNPVQPAMPRYRRIAPKVSTNPTTNPTMTNPATPMINSIMQNQNQNHSGSQTTAAPSSSDEKSCINQAHLQQQSSSVSSPSSSIAKQHKKRAPRKKLHSHSSHQHHSRKSADHHPHRPASSIAKPSSYPFPLSSAFSNLLHDHSVAAAAAGYGFLAATSLFSDDDTGFMDRAAASAGAPSAPTAIAAAAAAATGFSCFPPQYPLYRAAAMAKPAAASANPNPTPLPAPNPNCIPALLQQEDNKRSSSSLFMPGSTNHILCTEKQVHETAAEVSIISSCTEADTNPNPNLQQLQVEDDAINLPLRKTLDLLPEPAAPLNNPSLRRECSTAASSSSSGQITQSHNINSIAAENSAAALKLNCNETLAAGSVQKPINGAESHSQIINQLNTQSYNIVQNRVIVPQPIRLVSSSIRLESITEVRQEADDELGLGGNPSMETVEKQIQSGDQPAIITDSSCMVRWVNSAYQHMIGQPECPWLVSTITPRSGAITGEVVLSSNVDIPNSAPSFSGIANIRWTSPFSSSSTSPISPTATCPGRLMASSSRLLSSSPRLSTTTTMTTTSPRLSTTTTTSTSPPPRLSISTSTSTTASPDCTGTIESLTQLTSTMASPACTGTIESSTQLARGTAGPELISMTVPCDVCRNCKGMLVWRFDTQASLTLTCSRTI